MKRLSSLLAMLLLIITGCNTDTGSKESSGTEQPIKEVAEQPNSMPEEMPAMFDFLVRFGYGEVAKNEVNTYQDTVTKDLVVKGTATADITLSMDEMRSIYEKMREINIMGTKELVPTNSNCAKTPYMEDSWKISIDGETKTLTWSEKSCDTTDDAKQLLELRNFIQHIVASKDAYKALPEIEGGYD
ncbi:hypothetical protein Back11_41780 [Paenibacillus baekrokdamisoli]|uniref:Uncharacterized protein n=1 Tax=Paenibacillus baekrokdamisoli TaxID=1712516 RepID=A0A3G9JD08_9BACL|nr:hypothetical protein [Paenibacillus baekrokdamisoli]MBB3068123.1 PBP1b-binding outer membrane lipoprotein LpoB [Paenibacillus baekrokdamisoli]BBH22833.1 hypothetical protein Back11_41780 [Paenibacillus baekrokdamisoli]